MQVRNAISIQNSGVIGIILFVIFLMLTSAAFGQSKQSGALPVKLSQASATGVRMPDSLRQSTNNTKTALNDIEFEFGSLVVDETQTKIGHDFYDLFYAHWDPPEEIRSSTIVVSEKALPRLGTQVTVKINDAEVFQNFIQPRYDAIEEMATYAVSIALDYLMNYEQIQLELQGADMQGSGIF